MSWCASGDEALNVDGLTQPDDLDRGVQRAYPLFDTIAESHHSIRDPRDQRRERKVEQDTVANEHPRGSRELFGQCIGHPAVLRDDDVAVLGQVLEFCSDRDAARRGEFGHLAEFDSVDRDIVAETVELLGDGHR
ncbi:MAG: hypothetical protein JWQ81_5894 [Amycolatopsis sp.]|nr:hypothetical protein [Amycolatopsis sp.]